MAPATRTTVPHTPSLLLLKTPFEAGREIRVRPLSTLGFHPGVATGNLTLCNQPRTGLRPQGSLQIRYKVTLESPWKNLIRFPPYTDMARFSWRRWAPSGSMWTGYSTGSMSRTCLSLATDFSGYNPTLLYAGRVSSSDRPNSHSHKPTSLSASFQTPNVANIISFHYVHTWSDAK